MKRVVFFGCERTEVARLVDILDEHEFSFVAFNSTDHADGIDFGQIPSVTVVDAPFASDKAVFNARAQEVLSQADILISQREPMIPFLAEVIDYVSESAKQFLPSKQALLNASNKNLMREAFSNGCPEYSVKFLAFNCEQAGLAQAIRDKHFSFPVMLKPANEMSSLFVQRYNDEDSLIQAAEALSAKLVDRYKEKHRNYAPYVVIEEYIEGEMYTIASWVDAAGGLYHFPVVRVLNAKDIGRKGYYLYSRYTLDVSEELQAAAELAAAAATRALGLRSSSMHVELIMTSSGFKIVEVGARVGGYRQWMYETSYGLDCFMNDFAVRSGQELVVNGSFKEYCSVIHLFPQESGIISALYPERLKELSTYSKHVIMKQPGAKAGSSAEGVMAVGCLFLQSSDFSQLQNDVERCKDIQFVEVAKDSQN